MSMSMAISEGLMATIIGMGIVFGVLIILAATVSMLKYLVPSKPGSGKNGNAVETPEIGSDIFDDESKPAENVSDDELAAVIAAAVSAFMGDGAYAVKSITPVRNASKPWNITARKDNQRGLY